MQLVLNIQLEEPLVLPMNYNHIVQSIIYRALSVMPDYAEFCINPATQAENANIKCFSLVNCRDIIKWQIGNSYLIQRFPWRSEVRSHCL